MDVYLYEKLMKRYPPRGVQGETPSTREYLEYKMYLGMMALMALVVMVGLLVLG